MKIISKKKSPKDSPRSKHRVYVTSLIVGVVIIGGVIVWLTHAKKAKAPAVTQISQTTKTAISQAYKYEATSNFNQAYKALDSAISQAKTDPERATLYNEKSIAAINAKDYGLALATAQQSEKLNPTISSAHIIAESSEQLGDKTTAINYLKKQIDRMTHSGQPYIQEDVDALQAKIKQLGASS